MFETVSGGGDSIFWRVENPPVRQPCPSPGLLDSLRYGGQAAAIEPL